MGIIVPVSWGVIRITYDKMNGKDLNLHRNQEDGGRRSYHYLRHQETPTGKTVYRGALWL